MQCPNCGKDNLPDAQFCENCGQSLLTSQQTFIQPIPPKKNNAVKYILGVFIGLLLSILAVGTITLVHNSLAQRPAKTSTKLKTETLKDPPKDEKDDSSAQKDSSSDDDANVDSSDEQEVDQNAPKPVVANGQTTTWVSDDGPVLTINGTTTVTISTEVKYQKMVLTILKVSKIMASNFILLADLQVWERSVSLTMF